jgi:hypothetical protein
MKFKLSGTQKTFATVAAVSTSANNAYIMVISGAGATNAQNGQSLNILLNSAAPFTANTQFSASFISGTSALQALVSYADNAQPGKGYTSSYPNLTPGAKAQVTITEISATAIKGTFSATLVDEADFTTVKYMVTDGEFNIKLTQQ